MKLTEIQETVTQITHSGKIHLDPNCRYVRNANDVIDRPSESIPENHVDLCSWCERYFAEWDSSVSLNGESECERCGKRGIEWDYCDDCEQQIRLRR
jgi:hypothetical protein